MSSLSIKQIISHIDNAYSSLLEQLATCGLPIEETENLRGQIVQNRSIKGAVLKITSKQENQAAE